MTTHFVDESMNNLSDFIQYSTFTNDLLLLYFIIALSQK